MRSIRDMEREAARMEALRPADRAKHEAELREHRQRLSIIDEVAAERHRQVFSEGYTSERDDLYGPGPLPAAAIAYTVHAIGRPNAASWWPWGSGTFKPWTARRNLVKAAALIIAEIERMDRHEGRRS